MALQKTYSRINWENYPSENTPLNETNLNRIDYATDTIDDRVITLDTEKFATSDAYTLVKSVELANETGILTVTYFNGTTSTYQTVLNKVAVNFSFNSVTQAITITNEDGTTETVDLSAFITQYEFVDTSTISFYVSVSGKVSASVIDGSITEAKMQPNYLADIRVSEANAATSESNAESHMLDAEAWAVGQRNGTAVDSTDTTYENNSKYYSEQSASSAAHCDDVEAQAQELLDAAIAKVADAKFSIDFDTGIMYCESDAYTFSVDYETGWLQMEVNA